MTNLLKCLTCNKILTGEESKNHHCKPIIKKHKVIPASSYFEVTDDNGVVNLVIDGLDQIGYVFEIKEPKIMPIELPCDTYQPTLNTKNHQPSDEQSPMPKGFKKDE